MSRKRNHGPAIEMWSVVHFPNALINTLAPKIFFPSQGKNGANNCKRSDVSLTETWIPNRLQLVLEIQDLQHQILLVVIRRLMVHPVLPHPHFFIN
jgi:hypothetical protein